MIFFGMLRDPQDRISICFHRHWIKLVLGRKKLFVDDSWCRREVSEKIGSLDFAKLREDVKRFLKPVEVASLNLWTREFFWSV